MENRIPVCSRDGKFQKKDYVTFVTYEQGWDSNSGAITQVLGLGIIFKNL